MREYFGRCSREEIAGQAFAINISLLRTLSETLGIPFVLTLGWLETDGKPHFEHGDELLERLMKDGISAYPDGLPLYAWLTSPACEVVDATLPTTIAAATGEPGLAGGIVYISNQDPPPSVIYHPTVVGIDFLDKIGATIALESGGIDARQGSAGPLFR